MCSPAGAGGGGGGSCSSAAKAAAADREMTPAHDHNADYLESGLALQQAQFKLQEDTLEDLGVAVRRIKSLVSCLPALDTPSFHEQSVRSFSDALLVAYLGCITKGVGTVNDVVDKYNLGYDKHSRRRGIF